MKKIHIGPTIATVEAKQTQPPKAEKGDNKMNGAIELTEKQIYVYKTASVASEACAPTLGFLVIMGTAVLLGGWGMTCLICGLPAASTLQEVGRGLITAITGI